MTFAELCERAKRQLNAGQPQPHNWADSEIDVAACVMQAKDKLAHAVMRDSERRAWLQQTYSLSLNGSGVGLLSAATASIAGEIIIEGIRFGVVIDNDSNILQPIIHYADFLRPQPTVYGYYCEKDASVLTRAIGVEVTGPASIQGAPGPLSITASFIPDAVDDVPSELEADLVQELVSIVATKLTPANAG